MGEATRRPDQLLGASAPRLARALGIVIFVVGGLLVFQTSDQMDPPKIGYMVATLIIVGAASVRLIREREVLRGQPLLLAWLSVSLAFGVMLAISLPVAGANGTPLTPWLRDAAPYALFAFAPVLAIDGRSLSRRFFVTLLIACGLIAAASFSIEWLGRRAIIVVPVERLILPTGILASTLLAYAAARAMLDRANARWILVGGTVLGLFFVTGTRSSLLLVAVPTMVALVARRSLGRTLGVAAGTIAIGLVFPVVFSLAVLGVAPVPVGGPLETAPPTPSLSGGGPAPTGSTGSAGSTAPPKPNFIGDRFGSIGSALGDPTTDASLATRLAMGRGAWAVFVAHPVLGQGPGHIIEWTTDPTAPSTGFTPDTPLVIPAKFGLLGLAVLAWLVVVYVATLVAHGRRGRNVALLTLIGFGMVFVLAALLNSPFEDKGFSYATILILGACLLAYPARADHDGPSTGDPTT